jgi:AcrR family transcriptional regulator
VARGRPREFDVDQALDRALEVFWSRGYEGASVEQLTEAMGINRPSLYAAFGTKEELFRRALDRYAEGPAAYVRDALDEPTARAAVERLLRGGVELVTDPAKPAGCFVVQGALACGQAAESVKQALIAKRVAVQAAVRKRLERAAQEGDLPAGADCDDLARYVVTVLHGLAVQAASGAKREELLRVVETALRAWPT